MKKERALKVGTHITPSHNMKPAIMKPSLLLQGHWLADAGIMPGDVVVLTINMGVIMITKF